MADGYVKIDIKGRTVELEKQLKEVEKELTKLEEEKHEIELEINESKGKEVEDKLLDILNKVEQLSEEKHEMGLELDVNDWKNWTDEQRNAYNEMSRQISSLSSDYAVLETESAKELKILDEKRDKLDEIERQIKETTQKQTHLNQEAKKLNFGKGVQDQLKQINNELGKSTKKVVKWGLAVFGVRSAYMGIRRMISAVRGENEEINAQFKAVESFFTTVFEPLVQRIVNGMMKLVQWTNYLLKAWFGVDFLAKSTEKSMKGTGKQAQALKKTLTGFDEMNILNEDGSTGVGGSVPEFPIPEEYPIPTWLKWVADNKDKVIAGLLGIAGGLLAVKLGLGGIKALGIGLIIFGTIELVKEFIGYIEKLDGSLENNGTSWEDFGRIVKNIGIIILGIGLIIGGIPLIIAGALTLIVGLVLSNWNKIKGYLDTAFKWIDGKLKWLENTFGIFGRVISGYLKAPIDIVKTAYEGLFKSIKKIFDGILLIFKGDFKNGLTNIAKGIGNAVITVINVLISAINGVVSPIRALIVGIGKVTGKKWTMGNIKIPTIKYLAEGGIINTPGKGVPISSNIRGGERGEEVVLPLTNDNTMDYLGEKIAKHVKVDVTSILNIDKHTLLKILKQAENENNFVMNR